MRLDLKVSPQLTTWRAFADVCTAADDSGMFTGLWAFDHLAPVASGGVGNDPNGGCFEGWSTLAALAALTSTVKLGLLVSAAHYRNVGVLAQTITTIDHISDGRVEVGLGAGNNAAESECFGLAFASPRERAQHLDEYVAALAALLAGSACSFDGSVVQLREARTSPAPIQRRIPLIVGGKGEQRTLKTAAQRCDGWNYSTGSPAEFAAKLSVLAAHAHDANRDPATVRKQVQVRVDDDPAPAVDLAHAYAARGATDIVLYINPLRSRLEAAMKAADELVSAPIE